MSFHQKKAIALVRDRVRKNGFFIDEFINMIRDMVKARLLFEAKIGQGLTFTRWKGLNFLIIYFASAM